MTNEMKNQNKACEQRERILNAAALYLERRGYDIVDVDWQFQSEAFSGSIGIVAREDETLVFVDVAARPLEEGGFDNGADREELELLGAYWLKENGFDGDLIIRFDKLSLVTMGGDRALLRHHINAWG